MIQVEVILGDRLRADFALQREMAQLAAPSYRDASSIMVRESAKCDRAYLGRDRNHQLVCFLLTKRSFIQALGERLPTIFMGLSVASDAHKGFGSIAYMWRQSLEDTRAWQRQLGQQVIVWATTATPSIYFAFMMLDHFEPKLDGSFSDRGRCIAQALGSHLSGRGIDESAHPFVLKALATGTEYSEVERERIARISAQRGFGLFEQLGIDEAQWDRLICFGYLSERIERFLSAAMSSDGSQSSENGTLK